MALFANGNNESPDNANDQNHDNDIDYANDTEYDADDSVFCNNVDCALTVF
jgi:hypothetical protein